MPMIQTTIHSPPYAFARTFITRSSSVLVPAYFATEPYTTIAVPTKMPDPGVGGDEAEARRKKTLFPGLEDPPADKPNNNKNAEGKADGNDKSDHPSIRLKPPPKPEPQTILDCVDPSPRNPSAPSKALVDAIEKVCNYMASLPVPTTRFEAFVLDIDDDDDDGNPDSKEENGDLDPKKTDERTKIPLRLAITAPAPPAQIWPSRDECREMFSSVVDGCEPFPAEAEAEVKAWPVPVAPKKKGEEGGGSLRKHGGVVVKGFAGMKIAYEIVVGERGEVLLGGGGGGGRSKGKGKGKGLNEGKGKETGKGKEGEKVKQGQEWWRKFASSPKTKEEEEEEKRRGEERDGEIE